MPKCHPHPNPNYYYSKIGDVIIPNPNFILKLITCLTPVRKRKKKTFKLEFFIFYFGKNEEPKIPCNEFRVSSGSESGFNWGPVPSFGSGC
jgi:hypothetical protein